MLGSEPAATSITDVWRIFSTVQWSKKHKKVHIHIFLYYLSTYLFLSALSIYIRRTWSNLTEIDRELSRHRYVISFQSIICIRQNFWGNFQLKNDPKKVYNLIKYHIYNLELIDVSKFIYQLAASMYNSKTWTDHLSQLCASGYAHGMKTSEKDFCKEYLAHVRNWRFEIKKSVQSCDIAQSIPIYMQIMEI